MWNDLLARINTIDLVMAVVLVRAIYIGLAEGFVVEVFKLLGTFLATFIVLHYYFSFAVFSQGFVPLPLPSLEFLSFVLLWFWMTALFAIVRSGWMLGFKTDKKTPLIRLLGGCLSIPRAILTAGLIFMLIFVSGNKALDVGARKSLAGFYFLEVSSDLYRYIYDQAVARTFPSEKKNAQLFEMLKKSKKDSLKVAP